jgi:L-ascorbate metabolism protein UlaG (beta-lactamase superfamily)
LKTTYIKRGLLTFGIFGIAALAWVLVQWNTYPALSAYSAQLASPLSDGPSTKTVNVTAQFFGVSTLVFNDGDTAIMTDGFFTRPGLTDLGKLAPDVEIIKRSLQRAGITKLAAIIPLHSHYDHILDAPVVAQLTGALLVGSKSSANVGRGYGLPEQRIRSVENGQTLRFGRFNVTFIESAHGRPDLAPGTIDAPLAPPAKGSAFKSGECYSVLIEHMGKTFLVQSTVGFRAGALVGRQADIVYLGIGGLGRLDDTHKEAYWREMVTTVSARRVVPIHWDNDFIPISEPLIPYSRLLDDFDGSMAFLLARGKRDQVDIRLPITWSPMDPYSGLE